MLGSVDAATEGREARRVYRTSGRDTDLKAEFVVGSRSVDVVLLDISGLGAGIFVPRDSARALAPKNGEAPSTIRLRLHGFGEGDFLSLPIQIVHRRVYPEGIRLSMSFVLDEGRRATLSQRLCEALNERRAIRVRPPEGTTVVAAVELPDLGWIDGRLIDASAVGLGLDLAFDGDGEKLLNTQLPVRIAFEEDADVHLDARLVRVVPIRNEHGREVPGRALFGMAFEEDGEGFCVGGVAVGRWVVRQQLAARAEA